ncbi:MAG: aldo/keto reductase [Massiliimalia sp.]|jgi:predicted aldo/keto reductase-like oxidoreductase
MTYQIFKKTNQKVSRLGFGAMRFPLTADGEIDEPRAEKMLDEAYHAGVNYFDTAYMYHDGKSQSFLGKVLKKYPRDSFFITNKLPIWMCDTPEDMERIFQDQLEKCQVEYFDFYLLHSLGKEHYEKCEKFGAYEFVRQKQAEGKIKNLGFSFHDTPDCLERICSDHEWDFAQLQLNYLDWEYQNAKEQYAILERYNLPCIVMEPVRGGALADLAGGANEVLKAVHPDASIASWAVRFAASQPNVLVVLSGMTTEEQVADNLKTFADFKPLSDEEMEALWKALELHKATATVPCTACKYCIDCPAGVNIPEMFRIYNNYKLSNNANGFLEDMKAKADCDYSHCVECGICMEKCPQHIEIPERLKEIGALVEQLKR